MRSRVGALFGEVAVDYDSSRRRLVPGFDGFYGAAVAALPFRDDEAARVLDLGAGTGLLSAMVAERYPGAEVTLVDVSEEMLEVARRRFASEPGRMRFLVADYAATPLSETVTGEYEAVVSALSIHHLRDVDKETLFYEVHRMLVPGGVFVNADQTLGDTPKVEKDHRRWWLERTRESGAGEEEISAALKRMKEDRSATLRTQLRWMEEAGFEAVGCEYEDHGFAVYNGKKPKRVLSTERTDG